MENITVSIIIPAYNSEKYLNQCIDSLIVQTRRDFEIICVDDGSTDGTHNILENYKRKDDRITLLTQNNLYAGIARNKGLEKARGKYVLFLDADDFFCRNMIEELVESAEYYQTEVLVFDAYQFDNREKRTVNTTWRALRKNFFDGNGIKSASEVAKHIFDFTVPAPWNKLFLRDFILRNHIYFQPLKRTNDLYFVYTALTYAERIALLDKKLLYYRDYNLNSLQGTAGSTPAMFMDALSALKDNLTGRGVYSSYQTSFRMLTFQICIHNINKISDSRQYDLCRKRIREEFFPNLEFQELLSGNQETFKCLQTMKNGENIIIYGAGDIAKALLHFMLVSVQIKSEKIKIVVSNKNENASDIYGIPVMDFSDMETLDRKNLVIIAVSDIYYKEVEDKLKKNNFIMTIKMGFEELMKLIINSP